MYRKVSNSTYLIDFYFNELNSVTLPGNAKFRMQFAPYIERKNIQDAYSIIFQQMVLQ